MRSDRFDVRLHDPDQLAEIEMLTDLILACSSNSGPLADDALDALLGLALAKPA
jgi:hypothetical protein